MLPRTTPAHRALLLALLTSGIAAAAGAPGPAAPPAATLLHVAPAVRRIVRTLRQIDIPPAWRRRNWIGDRGQGSCVHAALVHLWHWQGRHELAERWAAQHGNGETADGLAAKLDRAGVRYAETRAGDEAFLEWALRTRRGAAVVVQNGGHMVNLVGLDRRFAHILDSNFPERAQRWPRDSFLRDWKQSGGWAVTPLGTPPPPEPWIVKSQMSNDECLKNDEARSTKACPPSFPGRAREREERAASMWPVTVRHSSCGFL